MTFREFVKARYGDRASDNSDKAIDLVAYDILHDKNFPDNEPDGMMVRSYIRNKQGNFLDEDNKEMVEIFEMMWIIYKGIVTGKYERAAGNR